MAIPKIIHYCWFGGNPFPPMIEDCINSWKKYCPDYEIIQWNENNFDFSECKYAQDAYENKNWSFVSDYVRHYVIYKYGGIYLDTDVKLIKSLDNLLNEKAYAGFEDDWTVNTGIGFGAEKNDPIVKELYEAYFSLNFFNDDGTVNPIIQPKITTDIFVKHGLQLYNNKKQKVENFTIYPIEYFCPYDIKIKKMNITPNTYSIHYYTATWYNEEQRRNRVILTRRRKLEKLIGKKLYKKWETIRFILFEDGFKSIIKSKFSK